MNSQNETDRYEERRRFFDERADGWLDMCYKDSESGEYTRHDAGIARLLTLVELPPDGCVLDVGCGSGVLVPYVLQRLSPAGRIIEADYSSKMIEANRRLHSDRRITFITADVMDMGLPSESVDVVLCFSCFPHFDPKAEAVRAMTEVLKPGGRLAIAHVNSSTELNNHHRKHGVVMHDMLPDGEQMREFISSADLKLETFLDETGFYLVLASKAV